MDGRGLTEFEEPDVLERARRKALFREPDVRLLFCVIWGMSWNVMGHGGDLGIFAVCV